MKYMQSKCWMEVNGSFVGFSAALWKQRVNSFPPKGKGQTCNSIIKSPLMQTWLPTPLPRLLVCLPAIFDTCNNNNFCHCQYIASARLHEPQFLLLQIPLFFYSYSYQQQQQDCFRAKIVRFIILGLKKKIYCNAWKKERKHTKNGFATRCACIFFSVQSEIPHFFCYTYPKLQGRENQCSKEIALLIY